MGVIVVGVVIGEEDTKVEVSFETFCDFVDHVLGGVCFWCRDEFESKTKKLVCTIRELV